MSKNYDNWERLVTAVTRRERDKQIALSHSTDPSSISSTTSSSDLNLSSTSQFDHHQSLFLQERRQSPADYSDLTLDDCEWKTMLPPQEEAWRSAPLIGEEARWLREEHRWLREEQRWLREESRWKAERQAFLQEISSLKLRIQELERLNSLQGVSVSETVAKLLEGLKEGDLGKNVNRTADRGTIPVPLVVEAAKTEEEVVVKEVISIPDKNEIVKRKATLRKGSEGDEVPQMQEALRKLGFYSGEEDIEFSSFSSGTERAVKTWQATLGPPEDSIMTAELLGRLIRSSGSGVTKEDKATNLEKNVMELGSQTSSYRLDDL